MTAPPQPKTNDRRTILASFGALSSVLAASSCCLPLLPFAAGAGLAGGSAFFAVLRPYLLIASVLSIGFGFYQARRARQCDRRTGRVSLALLWFSAAVITATILFPQVVAGLLAG